MTQSTSFSKKINQTSQSSGMHNVSFEGSDFTGMGLEKADLLGHLDYLNQKQYINAEFSGNAYANQQDVPNVINPKEVDARVANTLGAKDGPLPHLITFKRAELTEKGRKMLADMDANLPANLEEGPDVAIPDEHMSFLKKVMLKGNLTDPYDARDVTEVVFRVMRDVMTTEEADRVEADLSDDVAAESARDKSLHVDVAELWHDTNPIVSFFEPVASPP